jgi:hypothetical protein
MHPISRGTISCGEKHEKTDNKTLHLTPKARAFLAFAIFSIKRRFCKVIISFWCW